MSTHGPSLLVIDDESGILQTLRILLRKSGFEVRTAQGGKAGLEAIKAEPPDIVLTDVRMPHVGGLDILQATRDQDPETPVILMTAQASLQTAIQAVNDGAFYYIQKPFSNDDMVAICRRASETRQLRAENRELKTEIRRRDKSVAIKPLGKARCFVNVLEMAEPVAPTDATALLLGESGTGQEVMARCLLPPPERTEAPSRDKPHPAWGAPPARQRRASAAAEGPQDSIAEQNAIYQRRRDRLVEALRGIGLRVTPPKASLYIWAGLPDGVGSIDFAGRLLDDTGVVVTPGIGYGQNGEGYVRLSLTVPDDRLDEGIRRLQGSRQ